MLRWEATKGKGNQGGNFGQQPNKRPDTVKAYNVGSNVKKYTGNKPLCNRCNFHHYPGACSVICGNCKKTGHIAKDCKGPISATNVATPGSCFNCGVVGHLKKNCPNLRNQNGGNNGNARGRAFVIGAGEAREDPNLVTGTFLLNNCYASVLFDTGADKSFVSEEFSLLINIPPTALDAKYIIELANGKLMKTDKIFQGCTLSLEDHSFDIDLMPVELGSFDIVIGMDWLSKNRDEIVCGAKIVRIPLTSSETLVIQEERSGTKLNIISCMKARKCLRKGCQTVLAHVKEKKP